MRFNTMRWIVMIGYLIGIAHIFLPIYDGHSNLEIIRFNLTQADFADGLFGLMTMAARIGFLALVIWRPARWVFIAGAGWAALVMLFNFVVGPPQLDQAADLIPFITLSLRMVGFFALSPRLEQRYVY